MRNQPGSGAKEHASRCHDRKNRGRQHDGPRTSSLAVRRQRCGARFAIARPQSAWSSKCRRSCARHPPTQSAARRCHAAMALLHRRERELFDSLVGKTINDYTITRDDIENALRPAFAYVDALLDHARGRILSRASRRLSDHRQRLRHCRPARTHRRHRPCRRLQIRHRRARSRASPRRR